MRFLNCIMIAIAVLIGAVLVAKFDALFAWQTYAAMFVAFVINGAGNAFNDYFDVEADRINRPKRPIPAGQVSMKGALAFSITLFVIGIILSAFINYVTFAIAAFNSLLLVAYSAWLQDRVFIGNIAISYMVGSGFLFGGAAMGNLMLPLLLMLLAFFSNMGREVVKGLEDMEGDRTSFLKKITSAIKEKIAQRFRITRKGVGLKVSVKKLKLTAVVFLLLAIAVSPVPYLLGIFGLVYLMILVPTDIVLLLSASYAVRSSKKEHYHKTSKLIKLGMFLGLLAFIAGALL